MCCHTGDNTAVGRPGDMTVSQITVGWVERSEARQIALACWRGTVRQPEPRVPIADFHHAGV